MNKIKYFILALLIGFTALMFPTLKSANAEESIRSNANYIEYYIPFNDILVEESYYRRSLEITDISILINYDKKSGEYSLISVEFTFEILENGVSFAKVEYDLSESVSLTDYLLNGMNYLAFNISEVGGAYYFELYGCSKDYIKREEISTWTYEIRGQEEDIEIPYIVRMISDNSIFWSDNQQGYREGYNKGYNVGFDEGSRDSYNSGYNKGYEEGLAVAENDFFSLFTGIADTPFMIITSLLSFEIFGVNAFVVLFSILTICIIIWLIKKFMV